MPPRWRIAERAANANDGYWHTRHHVQLGLE
jgi:hypothetical protein